jgi:hypothetical protein
MNVAYKMCVAVNLTPKTLYQILSENFRPEYWVKTEEAYAE